MESASDQSSQLEVYIWATIGIPTLFCDFNYDNLLDGESIAANSAQTTWSNGEWGRACGYYTEYQWKGTNGYVQFNILSNGSFYLSVLPLVYLLSFVF